MKPAATPASDPSRFGWRSCLTLVALAACYFGWQLWVRA